MYRRDVIKSLLASLSVGAFAVPAIGEDKPQSIDMGALQPDRTSARIAKARPKRTFYDRFATFRGISKQTGNVLLYKHLEKEIGKLVPHYQGPSPSGADGEGDCVAQAGSLGADILAGVNIHLLGKREKFIAKSSVEMNYAGSRCEIGKKQLAGGGGSRGIWMAQFLKEYGVLHRINYSIGGQELDLTGYDPERSRKYRDQGVPDWLEPTAKEHPVKEFTQVVSGRMALDAVAAGQIVLLCSTYAFGDTRDAQGFTAPLLGMTTRRGRWFTKVARPVWRHCMLLAGKVNYDGREGGTVINSAGLWNSGPQPDGMPDGSFNVETQYLDMMVSDWNDCWALSSYHGHEAERVKHKLY